MLCSMLSIVCLPRLTVQQRYACAIYLVRKNAITGNTTNKKKSTCLLSLGYTSCTSSSWSSRDLTHGFIVLHGESEHMSESRFLVGCSWISAGTSELDLKRSAFCFSPDGF